MSLVQIMPRYSQSFELEPTVSPDVAYVLHVRYYSAWNPDGSREPVDASEVYWPEVTVTDVGGNRHHQNPSFSKEKELKIFSGYATVAHYVFGGPNLISTPQTLTVEGFFEQAGYISLSLRKYLNAGTEDFLTLEEGHFRGDELAVLGDGLNPFVKGNPSVFSYERPTPNTLQPSTIDLSDVDKVLKKSPSKVADTHSKISTSKSEMNNIEFIDFYRPSSESFYNGEWGDQETIAPDGCSADYIVSGNVNNSEKMYFVLKMKMPTTFISSDSPDRIYGDYQVQELVVDTYLDLASQDQRYTLNSRQLNDYIDADGYTYVFLAPQDIVTQLANQQGLNYSLTKIPPIHTWNGKIGYVLDKGIVNIRHRGSDPSWEGSLTNTTCYLTDADMEPINPSDLGMYYPELTGLDDIGIVIP